MKLKEIVNKKLEMDKFISEGSNNQQVKRALGLQPEMADFELFTRDRDPIPFMAAGSGYETGAKVDADVPLDIAEKFEALYKKYLQIK